MQIIYGIEKIRKFKNSVVALGVFDGVHRGHRYILKEAVKSAKRTGGKSVVITFYPHPQAKESLYSLKHRLKLIESLGIDACIIVKFTSQFAKISAVDFIKNILIAKIGAKYIYVGRNFRFGRKAKGDWRLLEKLSKIYGYKVRLFSVMKINGKPVSSTYIRKLVKSGKLNLAQKLLQAQVTVLGTVRKGISLARKLGFPTANIDPHHEVLPPAGVYAVKVVFENKNLFGVCNVGRHPEKSGKKIEVYIFNFRRSIYGRDIQVQFIRKIRQEKKFTSFQAASKEIRKDALCARKIFSLH